MYKNWGRLLYDYLLKTGMGEGVVSYHNLLILLLGILVDAFVLDLILWNVLRAVFIRSARTSQNNFHNFLLLHHVLLHVEPLFPLLCFVYF